jgi:hypothetical protein
LPPWVWLTKLLAILPLPQAKFLEPLEELMSVRTEITSVEPFRLMKPSLMDAYYKGTPAVEHLGSLLQFGPLEIVEISRYRTL